MIRDVTADDEEALYRFNSDLSERPLSRPNFALAFADNIANSNNKYLIAEVDGLPVGMGSCHVQWLLHHAEPIAEIQELFVLTSYRSMGIGKLLVRALEEFARSLHCEQAELSTNRKRVDAHRFYAREGYSDTHLKWVKKL